MFYWVMSLDVEEPGMPGVMKEYYQGSLRFLAWSAAMRGRTEGDVIVYAKRPGATARPLAVYNRFP